MRSWVNLNVLPFLEHAMHCHAFAHASSFPGSPYCTSLPAQKPPAWMITEATPFLTLSHCWAGLLRVPWNYIHAFSFFLAKHRFLEGRCLGSLSLKRQHANKFRCPSTSYIPSMADKGQCPLGSQSHFQENEPFA